MTDLRMEEPTPEEISTFEQHERVLEIAVRRAAEARSQARADAKKALLEHLEENKGNKGRLRL